VVLLPSRGGTAEQRIGPRCCMVEIDARTLPRRVILGNQCCNRRADESGITEIARAVGISAFHRPRS